MARRIPHLRCKVCGSPHGKAICPVRDLNAIKELAATELISLGLTPQLEMQIRALRRSWKEKAKPTIADAIDVGLDKSVEAVRLHMDEFLAFSKTAFRRVDPEEAADRLRQAWGARP